MTLTVIIINFNGSAFIKKCLDSVLSQQSFFPDFSIIVVDNASTDDSIDKLLAYGSAITLIKNKTNVGFPAAHNQLLNQLDTPYLWLLNNDTEFDHRCDIMTPMIQCFENNPDVVGISPKLLNTDGTIQTQGSSLTQWMYRKKRISAVRFLSGASLFIRNDFFQFIGGFDPNLFFYNDDVDFAFQARKHGKKLLYYPSLSVTHHGGLSTQFNPVATTIGGYFGSACLCKKYYSPFIFKAYRFILNLMVCIKIKYHKIVKSKRSNEWIQGLKNLEQKLRHDI